MEEEKKTSLTERTACLMEEIDRLHQESQLQIEENWRMIKRLGEKWGGPTEGLALPSMTKILRQRFGVSFVAPRVRAFRDGRDMEVDVLASSNSEGSAVYVVEVKSHLREEGIQQILKTLRDFRTFYPQFKDKALYGILTAVDIPPGLRERVLSEGLYLAQIHDGVFEIQVPEDFKPRAF
jgi:hypothetical protein